MTDNEYPVLRDHPAHKTYVKALADAKTQLARGLQRVDEDGEVYREALRRATTEGGPMPGPPPGKEAHRSVYHQAVNAATDAFEAAVRQDAEAIEVKVLEREATILAQSKEIAAKLDAFTEELGALTQVRSKVWQILGTTGNPPPVRTSRKLDIETLLLAARTDARLFAEPLVGA